MFLIILPATKILTSLLKKSNSSYMEAQELVLPELCKEDW